MHWRLLHSPPAPGAANMALDEALMARTRRTGECVLRIYGWAHPTLSFGRHQSVRDRYDRARIHERGLGVVRRPTGGRTILHHREVTYSVTAPAERLGSLRESYERINRLLMYGLDRLGVHVTIESGGARAPRPTEAPCFEAPVAGELSVNGRKLAGSAQWREDGALLQHGSILLDDDQTGIADLLIGAAPPAVAPATLRAVLGRAPAAGELAAALFDAVQTLEDRCAEPLEIDASLDAERQRALDRYLNDDWTWRR